RAIEGDEIDPADVEENPFTRDTRSRRSRSRNRPANGSEPAAEAEAEENGAIDAGILPPSIARDEEAPRRASTRRRRPRTDEGGAAALGPVRGRWRGGARRATDAAWRGSRTGRLTSGNDRSNTPV